MIKHDKLNDKENDEKRCGKKYEGVMDQSGQGIEKI